MNCNYCTIVSKKISDIQNENMYMKCKLVDTSFIRVKGRIQNFDNLYLKNCFNFVFVTFFTSILHVQKISFEFYIAQIFQKNVSNAMVVLPMFNMCAFAAKHTNNHLSNEKHKCEYDF
ncbi:Protein of unknown function [Gryllus bimaculatus]|nr:Protein of unknown function [Gryllus bimaculatus]